MTLPHGLSGALTGAALGLALIAAGCAARESGIRDHGEFRRVATSSALDSARGPAELAECFRDRAALLPMSEFRAEGDSTVYRLRGFGFSFEEIVFAPRPGGGTRATIRLAPNLDGSWHADFERDRGAALRLCAA